MSSEVIYTSAVKGLKQGTSGFCSVAFTDGIPPAILTMAESLSSYRPFYPIHDSRSSDNPTNHQHLITKRGGDTVHLLSQVSFTGVDYSKRSNKLAHHIILNSSELPTSGAISLINSNNFIDHWDQKPKLLPPPKLTTSAISPNAGLLWEKLTGDSGWGGVLSWHAVEKSGPIILIYRRDDHAEILPLLKEAFAIIKTEERVNISFQTLYQPLPAGIECRICCCPEGDSIIEKLEHIPNSLTIDITKPNLLSPQQLYPQAGSWITAMKNSKVHSKKALPIELEIKPKVAEQELIIDDTGTVESKVPELTMSKPEKSTPKVKMQALPKHIVALAAVATILLIFFIVKTFILNDDTGLPTTITEVEEPYDSKLVEPIENRTIERPTNSDSTLTDQEANEITDNRRTVFNKLIDKIDKKIDNYIMLENEDRKLKMLKSIKQNIYIIDQQYSDEISKDILTDLNGQVEQLIVDLNDWLSQQEAKNQVKTQQENAAKLEKDRFFWLALAEALENRSDRVRLWSSKKGSVVNVKLRNDNGRYGSKWSTSSNRCEIFSQDKYGKRKETYYIINAEDRQLYLYNINEQPLKLAEIVEYFQVGSKRFYTKFVGQVKLEPAMGDLMQDGSSLKLSYQLTKEDIDNYNLDDIYSYSYKLYLGETQIESGEIDKSKLITVNIDLLKSRELASIITRHFKKLKRSLTDKRREARTAAKNYTKKSINDFEEILSVIRLRKKKFDENLDWLTKVKTIFDNKELTRDETSWMLTDNLFSNLEINNKFLMQRLIAAVGNLRNDQQLEFEPWNKERLDLLWETYNYYKKDMQKTEPKQMAGVSKWEKGIVKPMAQISGNKDNFIRAFTTLFNAFYDEVKADANSIEEYIKEFNDGSTNIMAENLSLEEQQKINDYKKRLKLVIVRNRLPNVDVIVKYIHFYQIDK